MRAESEQIQSRVGVESESPEVTGRYGQSQSRVRFTGHRGMRAESETQEVTG